jgi:hypothetical protein
MAADVLEGRLWHQPTSKMERKNKKKRKLMKGRKKWTGAADEGEQKYKGWSDNGHKAFEQWTLDFKDDVGAGKYALWKRVFCNIHQDAQARNIRIKTITSRSMQWTGAY